MKKANSMEMRNIIGGAGKCRFCGIWLWTSWGAGIHAIKKHGKESWRHIISGGKHW